MRVRVVVVPSRTTTVTCLIGNAWETGGVDVSVHPGAVDLNNLDDWYEFHQAVLK